MIEGGAVDWSSHSNHLGRMIEEQIDFHHAIDVVIEWVEANGGWNENLVIITADHECGYLCGPDSVTTCTPVKCRGKGVIPEAKWHSDGHTNQLVPFYVHGAGTCLFVDKATGKDPVHGPYLDNADMGKILLDLMKNTATSSTAVTSAFSCSTLRNHSRNRRRSLGGSTRNLAAARPRGGS